jgi:hypothetical protein
VIDNGGSVMLHTVGPVVLDGALVLEIDNFNGGTINNGANVTAHFVGDVTDTAGQFHSLNWYVLNGSGFFNPTATGGTIVTGGNINVTFDGNVSTTGTSDTGSIAVEIQNGNGGSIASGGNITMTVGGNLNAGPLFLITENQGGHIGTGGNNTLNVSGDITTQADAQFQIFNNDNGNGSGPGTMGSNATINVSAANISTGGSIFDNIFNYNGGNIGGNAAITFNINKAVNSGSAAYFQILNETLVAGSPGGSISGDATVDVNVGDLASGPDQNGHALVANIDNRGGSIGGNASIDFVGSGSVNAQGNGIFQILNFNDGTSGPGAIGGNAAMNVNAVNFTTAGFLYDAIDNSNGGSIAGSANVNFNLTGDLNTGGDTNFQILNYDGGSGGGIIGADATLSVSAANISTGGVFDTGIFNDGGHITTGASVNLTVGGNLTTASEGSLQLFISNQPGTIGTDANISASIGGSVTAGQFAAFTIFNTEGSIGSNADITANIMGDLATGDTSFGIFNFGGGTIGSNAGVTVNIGGDLVVASDAEFYIWNYGLPQGIGSIGQNAFVNVNITGDLNAQGSAFFEIFNENGGGSGGGTIGSDATVTVNANNISTGGTFDAEIDNFGAGVLGTFGGTIGGNAVIDVTAANITANSLVAQIDNTGGSIGGNTEGGAIINMNVSGTATVTTDATVAIYGSDGAVGGADININGGNYNVGQQFLSYIDGNGTITFNNAIAHADVLKAGVFGTNGALNIGGGMLSADTTLKLYAPGSNGQLNFMSNVTLGGNSLKILAANSITIFNNIVVTIGGSKPADVYTNHANYTGFGGNGTTTGTFAGAGANNPQPLSSAPPFGPGSPVKLTSRGNIPAGMAVPPQPRPARTPAPGSNITSRTRIPPPSPSNVLTGGKIADVKRANNVINVRSSDELLSLLDGADRGPGGKITVPPSKNASHSKNSNRTDPAARLNAGSRVNVDHRTMDMRTASSSLMRRSPQ